jgi:hypothetical protein
MKEIQYPELREIKRAGGFNRENEYEKIVNEYKKLADEFFNSFINGNYPEKQKQTLQRYLGVIGRQPQQVQTALAIATVGHQFNEVEKKRNRKAEENRPYIFHPLEMAVEYIETVEDLGRKPDWRIVAALLLHDVPEDAKLGKRLDTPKKWLSFIGNLFPDEDAELIVGLVEAVTEEKKISPEWEKFIPTSEVYKIFASSIRRQGGERKSKKEKEEQEKKLQKVIYNLFMLFEKSLKDPKYWGALIIKVFDLLQNSKTDDQISLYKIQRGIIAASLAHLFGSEKIVDEILSQISKRLRPEVPFSSIRGNPIDSSVLEKKFEPVRNQLKRVGKKISEILGNGTTYFVGIPVYEPFESDPHSRRDGKRIERGVPLPQLTVEVPQEIFEQFRQGFSPKVVLLTKLDEIPPELSGAIAPLTDEHKLDRTVFLEKCGFLQEAYYLMIRYGVKGGNPKLIIAFQEKQVPPIATLPEVSKDSSVARLFGPVGQLLSDPKCGKRALDGLITLLLAPKSLQIQGAIRLPDKRIILIPPGVGLRDLLRNFISPNTPFYLQAKGEIVGIQDNDPPQTLPRESIVFELVEVEKKK